MCAQDVMLDSCACTFTCTCHGYSPGTAGAAFTTRSKGRLFTLDVFRWPHWAGRRPGGVGSVLAHRVG